jgi:hypothetical protein
VEEVDRIDLDFLQEIVGGWVEVIPCKMNMEMYLDEDGKVKGRDFNERATELARGFIQNSDYIVGDVVLVGEVDDDGESTGLSNEQIRVELGMDLEEED